MYIVTQHTAPAIPAAVARCPICGAGVVADIDAWEQNADDTWQVSETGVHCTCVTEPEIESPAWPAWDRWHFATPYMHWLPVQRRVIQWLQAHYRFEMDASSDTPP